MTSRTIKDRNMAILWILALCAITALVWGTGNVLAAVIMTILAGLMSLMIWVLKVLKGFRIF
jgi:hypothetical protein